MHNCFFYSFAFVSAFLTAILSGYALAPELTALALHKINICGTKPAPIASEVAGFLVYFDDPMAQATLDTYLPRDLAKRRREARASRRSPSQ